MSETQITIHLDGEPVILRVPATIADLLRQRDLPEALLSVALNGTVVPRARYADTHLGDGDELVGVIQVGGG